MENKISQNILQKRIMRRVYSIWFLRYLKSSRLVRVAGLITLAILLRFWVSFADVFSNIKGASYLPQYIAVSYQNTELTVQVILAVSGFLALLFIIDFGKLIGRTFLVPHNKMR